MAIVHCCEDLRVQRYQFGKLLNKIGKGKKRQHW